MLLKDIAEVKKFISTAQKNLQFDTFSPYIGRAEKQYILPLLGKTQFDALDVAYNNNTLSASQIELLAYIQPALSHYTLYLIMPFLQIKIGENGINQENTQDTTTARRSDAVEARREAVKFADSWAEDMLEYLEANAVNFPLWVAGEGFTLNYELLINSGAELGQFVSVTNNSRRAYLRLLPELRNCERLYIEKYVGKALLAEIKSQVKLGTVTALNKAVLDLCKPALAYVSMYEALPALSAFMTPEGTMAFTAFEFGTAKEMELAQNKIYILRKKYYDNGMTYLSELKGYLDSNVVSYPLYENSGIYQAPPTAEEGIEYDINNNENSSIFAV